MGLEQRNITLKPKTDLTLNADYVQEFMRQTTGSYFRDVIGAFQGGLNDSLVFCLEAGENVGEIVLRSPKPHEDRVKTYAAIKQEYDAIGATVNGVAFRFRTLEEQGGFIRRASMLGLQILPFLYLQDDLLIMRYVHGVPLHKYVQQQPSTIDTQVIEAILTNLTRAHKQGVVFGDRWTLNTMVTPESDFVELDFDIKLLGEVATTASFELSQTLYHLMHFSGGNRDFMKDIILAFYSRNAQLLSSYDLRKVRAFIKGQTEYFYSNYQKDGNDYEGLVPSYREVNALMNGLGKRSNN